MASSPYQYQKLQTGNSLIDRIQAQIQTAFNTIVGQFLGGRFLQNISVSTAGTVINHGLGRQPQLWTLCDQTSDSIVWRTAWDSNSITLIASVACEISIWVN